MSQKIPYCGGEAYLVDQVLLPCGDISAVMGEIANIPSPCRNNVEGVLNKNGLSYFNALLLATGVQRPIFSSGKLSSGGLLRQPISTPGVDVFVTGPSGSEPHARAWLGL